ncbi:FliH/SctL family protein [Isoptericola sp. NPDC057391]|uniref:FliH/SctL family protein n=1 Tax=Isoptericola sp. NPDC057391 TaxID=3346117 RepID=UPI00363B0B3A
MSGDATFVPQDLPVLRTARGQEAEEAAAARGYAAGYAAGLRAAQVETARARRDLEAEHARAEAALAERTRRGLDALDAAVRALGERTAPVVAEAHDALVRGALDLAEAVVGSFLADPPQAARAALARATAHVEEPVAAVRLHPDDVRLLTEAGADAVRLVPDATLDPGDAVAELEHGFLDARIRSAVARARAELADAGGETP